MRNAMRNRIIGRARMRGAREAVQSETGGSEGDDTRRSETAPAGRAEAPRAHATFDDVHLTVPRSLRLSETAKAAGITREAVVERAVRDAKLSAKEWNALSPEERLSKCEKALAKMERVR